MKNIPITRITEDKPVRIPKGSFASDWFRCSSPRCDYETRMKVLGNHPLCPKCNFLMNRL